MSAANVGTPFSKIAPSSIRKILILRFSSLGDIVMATAMIRCLRTQFPHAQIDMVVRKDFLDLIQYNPHLDRAVGLPRGGGMKALRALKRDLNRERYDLIYDAHRSLRSLWLMPGLAAEHKVYYQKHYLRRNTALTFKLPLLSNAPRMLERYIEPLTPFGVHYDNKGPELFFDDNIRKSADEKVSLPELSDKAFYIGIIPSAQWPGKRWPLERFRELMETILDCSDHHLILFGGPEDTFCGDLARGLPEKRVMNAQGKLSIAESGVVLARCRAVVANDTGLMHMADALNVPSVLILGPTSKELGCLPFHPNSRVVEHDLWCRPCSKNGQAPCIRKERYCLTLTSSDEVNRALVSVIESGQ